MGVNGGKEAVNPPEYWVKAKNKGDHGSRVALFDTRLSNKVVIDTAFEGDPIVTT